MEAIAKNNRVCGFTVDQLEDAGWKLESVHAYDKSYTVYVHRSNQQMIDRDVTDLQLVIECLTRLGAGE